jgi:hypothetical protein
MSQSLITIDALFSQTWQTMKSEWKATLKWTLGMVLVEFALQFISTWYNIKHPGAHPGFLALIMVITMVVAVYFSCGLMKDLLDKIMPDASRPSLSRVFGVVLVTTILLIPVMALGFILFIIPGVWLSVSLQFAMLAILDKKMPIEALKASWSLVKGRWWAVLGRNLMAGLIMIAVSMAVGFIVIGLALGLVVVGVGSVAASGLEPDAFVQSILMHPGQSIAVIAVLVLSGLFFLAISMVQRVFSVLFMTTYQVLLYRSLKSLPAVEPAPEHPVSPTSA